MIVTVSALLLNSASVIATPEVVPSQLSEIFQSACLDGEAKLPNGSAVPVAFEALPDELRGRLGSPASTKVWKINTEGSAFLYLAEYAAGSSPNSRVCGLASEDMDSHEAIDTIEQRVVGKASRDYQPSMQWLSPQAGYRAVVTSAGKFKIAQVNWLSDAQRDAAMKIYNQIDH
jgi:hypothetical protein